jgi:hypothetical protein
MDKMNEPDNYTDEDYNNFMHEKHIAELEAHIENLERNADVKAITMLYVFAGAITSLKEPITFSENHWATPAADIAAGIIKSNNLVGDCDFCNYKPFDYEAET